MVVRADGNQHRRKFQRDLLATQPDFSVRGRHPSQELFTVTDLSSAETRYGQRKGDTSRGILGFFGTNEFNLIAESDFDRLNNNGAYFPRLKRKVWGIFIVCLCVYFFFFVFLFVYGRSDFLEKLVFLLDLFSISERSVFKKATISLFIFLKKNLN